ncbi:hypothetical protein SH601_15775 [Gracilibacillus sp. S3-1-1]|uniref:Uncharacterized protein n=1 Tax=Gracilibacillus pellucidus TaxID=3095368 RepID=A0ACC6M9B8_9BACI|nr:hypothetical protein [Gracilibacillus sp. S3-1-1]MDX8047426.1 hypothetical protein [Gracilibacillus sp. S3-1-1]
MEQKKKTSNVESRNTVDKDYEQGIEETYQQVLNSYMAGITEEEQSRKQ